MKVQKQRWHDFTNYLILEADGHDAIFLEWREGEASKEILDWYRCLGYEDWGGNEEQILLKKSLS